MATSWHSRHGAKPLLLLLLLLLLLFAQSARQASL
jgi:hypothetical protein